VYTNTTRKKRYYENHIEEVKEKNKTYYERLKESNLKKSTDFTEFEYPTCRLKSAV
jgi:hypothetical protein